MQNHCAKEMQELLKDHFPNHIVTKIETGSCLEDNGHGQVSLLLWSCPKGGSNGVQLKHMMECSGEVPDENLKPCSYFASSAGSMTTLEIVLIAVLVTVFVLIAVALLLLGLLKCWKRKNVKAFTKPHCAIWCR